MMGQIWIVILTSSMDNQDCCTIHNLSEVSKLRPTDNNGCNFADFYAKLCPLNQTLPEAQRTQGIEFKT